MMTSRLIPLAIQGSEEALAGIPQPALAALIKVLKACPSASDAAFSAEVLVRALILKPSKNIDDPVVPALAYISSSQETGHPHKSSLPVELIAASLRILQGNLSDAQKKEAAENFLENFSELDFPGKFTASMGSFLSTAFQLAPCAVLKAAHKFEDVKGNTKPALTSCVEAGLQHRDVAVQNLAIKALPQLLRYMHKDEQEPLISLYIPHLVQGPKEESSDVARHYADAIASCILDSKIAEKLNSAISKILHGSAATNREALYKASRWLSEVIPSPSKDFRGLSGADGKDTLRAPISKKLALCL